MICDEADRSVAVATTETAATTAAAFTTTAAIAATAVGATETTATTFTAAATKTTTETARAGWAWLHGTSFVDHEITATQRGTVHAFDGSLRFGIAAHFDEAKTFGAAGVTLHHDLGARH